MGWIGEGGWVFGRLEEGREVGKGAEVRRLGDYVALSVLSGIAISYVSVLEDSGTLEVPCRHLGC